MDELKDKITEEELENVAGGTTWRPYLRCQKCGFECPISELNKYVDNLDGTNSATHKGCGGSIDIKIY